MPSSQQSAAQSPGRRRKQETRARAPFLWTRRLSFVCCWFVLVGTCLAALAAGLLMVGYHNATPIANFARKQFAPDLPIEIGTVSFPERGVVELRDITLDLPDAAGRAGEIKRIRIGYDESDVLRPRARSLLVESPDIVLDDALLAMFSSGRDQEAPPPNLDWAKLDTLRIVDGNVEFDLKGIPRGSLRVELDADSIDLGLEGAFLSQHPQRVTLRDFVLAAPEGGGAPIVVDEIMADLALNKDFISGAVAKLHLRNPTVNFTPEFLAALQIDATDPDAPAERSTPDAGSKAAPMRWTIDEIELENGHFAMSGFYDTPDLSFDHSGKFTNLTWSSDRGVSWPGDQVASLTDVRVDARALPRQVGAGDDPDEGLLMRAARIDIAGVPDEYFEHGWIDRITARKPEIHVSEERLRRFFSAAPDDRSRLLMPPKAGAAAGAGTSSPTEEVDSLFLIRVRDLELADAQVHIEADGFLGGLPETTFTLNLRSAEEQPTPAENIDYLLSATDLKVYTSDTPEAPIVTGTEILGKFSASGVQREERIDRITVSGLDVRIGEGVEQILAALDPELEPDDDPDDEPEPEPEPDEATAPDDAAAGTSPEWKIGQLELDEARFTLEKFIPGLPYVPLVLQTTLNEVPLSGRSRGDERPQKVELRNLIIASPYNSLLPVAKLRSIWVHFTVPGLIRNEIEKIEIVSPEIYLGEHLFWYIDYYRKFASNEPAAEDPAGEEKLAAISVDPCAATGDEEQAEAGGKIEAIENALKNNKISGWQIRNVEASTGSLIVAPKGYPLGILPFPFSAKTDLAVGKIELDLKVPASDYVFEDLELELRGLNGEAFFNYPIRKQDNNFVQTFTAPELLYQDYRADEVYLSLTYTETLIHGELGGKAYGGYANGEFNIYIGETYKWDAWVTGTGLELGPISEILAPETIKMTGTLDAKIITDGEGLIPAKVSGTMNTSGPCHMTVSKLDDVLDSIPEEWNALYKAISNAGIEAFQNYDFTSGSAKLQLIGRDGTASMLLDGPDGKRDIAFRFFDHRQLAGPEEKPQ